MEDIIVREIPLPAHIRAFTLPDGQGDYNVYINCALSAEQQKRSLRHELTHIRRDDVDRKACTAAELEAGMAAEQDE